MPIKMQDLRTVGLATEYQDLWTRSITSAKEGEKKRCLKEVKRISEDEGIVGAPMMRLVNELQVNQLLERGFYTQLVALSKEVDKALRELDTKTVVKANTKTTKKSKPKSKAKGSENGAGALTGPLPANSPFAGIWKRRCPGLAFSEILAAQSRTKAEHFKLGEALGIPKLTLQFWWRAWEGKQTTNRDMSGWELRKKGESYRLVKT